MWRYLRDPRFIGFDTIPECYRQTDRHKYTQIHDDSIYRASIAQTCKKILNIKNVIKTIIKCKSVRK